jgi:hypothetical protein
MIASNPLVIAPRVIVPPRVGQRGGSGGVISKIQVPISRNHAQPEKIPTVQLG